MEGGVAAKCGLQKDDEVLVVNSKSIDCLRNEKVLGYIRAQSKTGQLKVTVRRYTYKGKNAQAFLRTENFFVILDF